MRHPFLTPSVAALIACSGPSLSAQELAAPAVVDAAPAPTIAYQGRLLEGATAVNGARAFAFSILDSAGAEQWSSGPLTLTVTEGLYSVVLGSAGMPTLPVAMLGKAGLKLHVLLAGQALTPDATIVPAFQARSAWEVTGSFGGDLSGTQNQILIMKLQGTLIDLTTNAPATGQALVFNGTAWVPSTVVGTAGPQGLPGLQGVKGDTGATGSQGPIGLTGGTGPTGDTGATGTTGAAGTHGVDGRTVLNGAGGPEASGALGAAGDFYLDTTSNLLYGPKVGSAWTGLVGVSLVGSAGPQGAMGSAGAKGDSGSTGATGAAGATGSTGAKGETGSTGAAGQTGATGASPFTLSGTSAVYTAGSVGIGTSSPSAMLDVKGDARINGMTLGFGPTRPGVNPGNTVFGYFAGASNYNGAYNVALGWEALNANVAGGQNVAVGAFSLTANTGNWNTGIGYGAGQYLTTGGWNTLLGPQAGNALTTESYNIDISNRGTAGDSGTIRIGTTGNQTSTYIAGIAGVTPTGTTQTVVINSVGQLGSVAGGGGSGSGTVTSVSVTSANGFGGSVATATATPAITLSTSVTGLLKGNGTGVSAASAGTDYQVPLSFTSPLSNASNTVSLGTVGVANGGTGSATQNFVDLTTDQTIAGSKTFSGGLNVSTGSTYKLGGADLLHTKGSATNLFLGVGTGAVASGQGQAITAIGYGAGSAVTGAWNNTFVGYQSGAITTGSENSFFGKDSGSKTVDGQLNVFAGSQSGSKNTSGSDNAFFGFQAGSGNTTGTTNIAIGSGTGSALGAGSHNIYLGGSVAAEESDTIRIGYPAVQSKTFIAGIYNAGALTSPQSVVIDANGQLSSTASSAGTVTSVTVGGLPLSVATGTSTPVISLAQANTTTAGYLSSTDWNTFSGKAGLASPTFTGTVTAPTFAGALTGNVTAMCLAPRPMSRAPWLSPTAARGPRHLAVLSPAWAPRPRGPTAASPASRD